MYWVLKRGDGTGTYYVDTMPAPGPLGQLVLADSHSQAMQFESFSRAWDYKLEHGLRDFFVFKPNPM